MCARLWCRQTCGSGLLCLFCGRALRVVTHTDLGRLSAQATLFPKGECDHAPPLHFADQPRVTGKVGHEHLLSPLCQECTLTTGLSPLLFLETHTTELQRHVASLAPLQPQTARPVCLR